MTTCKSYPSRFDRAHADTVMLLASDPILWRHFAEMEGSA